MKVFLPIALATVSLLFAACAPSALAPSGSSPSGPYQPSATPIFISTPVSARVSKPGEVALGIKADSIGFGFEVTNGPLGFELKVPPRTGVFMRGSYVGEGNLVGLVASLNLAYESTDYGFYNGSTYQTSSFVSGGVALDLGYFFQIPLETARGYAGPRLYTYLLCEGTNTLTCSGPRFNPGATIGVNAKLGERFTISPEISAIFLPPDARISTVRANTLFSVSFSYRF